MTRRGGLALLLVAMMLSMTLSGCFGNANTASEEESLEKYPNIYDRHTLEWNWTGSYSRVLEDGSRMNHSQFRK